MCRRKISRFLCIVLSLSLTLSGCGGGVEKSVETERVAKAERTGDYVEKEIPGEDGSLMDNKRLYEQDDDTSIVTMYLTVRQGNEADVTDHTWEEINAHSVYYYEEKNLERFKVEGILQIGDENGPIEGEFGYGEDVPNVTVQIRGQTSSNAEQKSYKIRIKDGKGTWRDQQTLALNKHAFDPVRFRNKLSYDLMKTVPQMMSARTQFVHLYVKDETAGGNGEYVDYGIYTQVEQINRTYLKNHGLDNRGHLYKINHFEWLLYDDIMKLSTDADDDIAAFEEYLEIKGNEDPGKLQNVLKKINDYTVPIEEIIEQHFDVENLCYWMAFHILTGNTDVASRNYYLYSPLNSEKWYIISWDNDGSFLKTFYGMRGRAGGLSWDRGLTLFVNSRLYERMLSKEEYRDRLTAAVEDLKNHYLTEEIVDAKIKSYAEVISPYAFRYPDAEYLPVDEDEYEYLVDHMAEEIEKNYQDYQESLVKPWPFYVGIPEEKNGQLEVTWEVAHDPNEEDVTYSFAIAKDYQFTEVLYQDDEIRIPAVTIDPLSPGVYFMRVRAKNESGYEQDCFDSVSVYGVGTQYATKAFEVKEDGSISEYTKEVGRGTEEEDET